MLKKSFLILFVVAASLLSVKAGTIVDLTSNATLASFTDYDVTISGKVDVHITAAFAKTALVNSTVKLLSIDSWLFFDNVKPQTVIDSLLKYIYVGESLAVNKNNARVAIYKNGAVVMAHPSGFQPLTVFNERTFNGDSAKYNISTYYKALGAMDNKIRSFKLKRGYMATLAGNADGSGYSRVFIADKSDIELDTLNFLLDESISFIRVFEWEYVSKKGKSGWDPNALDGTVYYDWNIGGNSSENVEYAAIRQNGGWPSWDAINNKQGITHLLGFNEPDRPDQSNMLMTTVKAQWPAFMNSGLRVGSPAWSSAWTQLKDAAGNNAGNLFDFVDWCDANNMRLDFVALHCYWGGQTPTKWYNDLKYIHERTGRPLWITEWNNGANWTTETWPDADRTYTPANAAKQLNDMKGILQVLDTASFIERYFIYDWVQDCRAMILSSGLTEAGKYYKANKSQLAFTPSKEVVPKYTFDYNPTLSASYSTTVAAITVNDKNNDYCLGFQLERKVNDGEYEVIADVNVKSVRNYIDSIDFNANLVKYRVKTKLANGSNSNYSNEVVFSVAKGKNFQFGKMTTSNIEYNSVFYSQAYADFPAIVLGGANYLSLNSIVSPRVKFVNKNQRFTVQASPWVYQNFVQLPAEVSFPYFVCNPGTLQMGELQAESGRTTISATAWTSVNFTTAFDTVPVVFANQLLASTTNATVVRIKDVTNTGFKAQIKKEGAITTTGNPESVTWIAIEPGVGRIDDHQIRVGRTFNAPVSTGVYKLDTTLLAGRAVLESDIFLTQFQSCNDESTAQIGTMLYKGSPYLMKQVEKSITYTGVKSEDAGWIFIDPAKLLTKFEIVESKEFSIYPVPAYDFITINSEKNIKDIKIYSILGAQILSVQNTNKNKIDLSALPAGTYVLQTDVAGAKTFIKY